MKETLMDIRYKSPVAATPAASNEANAFFQRKLRFETDALYHDWKHGTNDYMVIDVCSSEAYEKSHVPHAINIPQAQLIAKPTAEFPPETLFVVHCRGPVCNGATKVAIKLSALGRPVKEMIGGIE